MKKQFRVWVEDLAGNLVARVYEAEQLTEFILDMARKDLGGRIYKIAEVGSDRDVRPEPRKSQLLELADPFGG